MKKNIDQGRLLVNEYKQGCHSCMWLSALTCCIILQSVIKIFHMNAEIKAKNEVKYGSGEMISKWRQVELSFLRATVRIDLSYKPTKYYLNISKVCKAMLRKNEMLTPAQPPADDSLYPHWKIYTGSRKQAMVPLIHAGSLDMKPTMISLRSF